MWMDCKFLKKTDGVKPKYICKSYERHHEYKILNGKGATLHCVMGECIYCRMWNDDINSNIRNDGLNMDHVNFYTY